MEEVRCFIAVELPEELRLSLRRLQDNLKRDSGSGVKWVDPAGIHLTLKFLGSVPADRVDDVIRAIGQSTGGIPPFRVETDSPGAFPNLKRPRVIWLGVRGDVDRLVELQRRIEANLVPLGFAKDERFSAHLTLARVRETVPPAERQKLGELVAAARLDSVQTIPVESVSLMRSELTPRGAIYSRLGSVELPAGRG